MGPFSVAALKRGGGSMGGGKKQSNAGEGKSRAKHKAEGEQTECQMWCFWCLTWV